MLGGADNPNGELPSYITGADRCNIQSTANSKCINDHFPSTNIILIFYTGKFSDVEMPSFINNTGFRTCPPLMIPPERLAFLTIFAPLALYYQDLLQLPG